MEDLKSQAGQVGIDLELTTAPFGQVVTKGVNCGPHGQGGAQLQQVRLDGSRLGGGVGLFPRHAAHGRAALLHGGCLPTPRAIATRRPTSSSSSTTDGPDSQTIPNMDAYENYLAKTLPVVFFPTATGNPTSASGST